MGDTTQHENGFYGAKESCHMKVSASSIWSSVKEIRENSPVIHNITNYVVMNNSANALLAIGASPVMAHAEEEMEEMVSIAGAAGHQYRNLKLALDTSNASRC